MSFISLRFKSFVMFILAFGILSMLVAPPVLSAANAPSSWRQSNFSGFGSSANKHVAALEVFNGQLYAGTWNDNGAQVWRSVDGSAWSQFMPGWSGSNTAVVDMAVYGNHLYVGLAKDAGRGEVWRTDGATWQQVIADGAGDPNNTGFLTFLTHGGKLYVATVNTTAGTQVWRSSSGDAGSWERVATNGFGGGATSQDSVGDTYGGYIYLGFRRTTTSQPELWRSADGTTWHPVFTDGLGNPANNHLTAISEFNGILYIGLRNSSGGEVWRSNDGTTWTPVFTGGLGKAANARPYGLIVHRQQLYVIFSNLATGAEVWRTSDGSGWMQVSGGGWGDAANGYADYFDKSAVVFNDSLFIGTMNETTGGQIWRDLHQVYLPLTMVRATILPPTDDMINIPAGTFSMGCDGAHPGGDGFCRGNFLPLHTVYLDAYRIGRTEVTNARYALCVAAGACTPPTSNSSATRPNYYGNPVYDNYPMINVTWHQAAAYCTWIGGRLPSEAEWEKAARGVSDTRAYPWGDAAPDCTLANVYRSGSGNCVGDTSAAGSYPAGASPFGALDMAGNVREWVNDWYSDSYYSVSPGSNPPGPETGTYKGARGNGWYDGVPMVFFRDYGTPTNTTRITGFRCAAALTQ